LILVDLSKSLFNDKSFSTDDTSKDSLDLARNGDAGGHHLSLVAFYLISTQDSPSSSIPVLDRLY